MVNKTNIAKIADVIFHTPAYMYYNVLYVVITMFLYIKKRYGYEYRFIQICMSYIKHLILKHINQSLIEDAEK
jgi:hypothetical protein